MTLIKDYLWRLATSEELIILKCILSFIWLTPAKSISTLSEPAIRKGLMQRNHTSIFATFLPFIFRLLRTIYGWNYNVYACIKNSCDTLVQGGKTRFATVTKLWSSFSLDVFFGLNSSFCLIILQTISSPQSYWNASADVNFIIIGHITIDYITKP